MVTRRCRVDGKLAKLICPCRRRSGPRPGRRTRILQSGQVQTCQHGLACSRQIDGAADLVRAKSPSSGEEDGSPGRILNDVRIYRGHWKCANADRLKRLWGDGQGISEDAVDDYAPHAAIRGQTKNGSHVRRFGRIESIFVDPGRGGLN